MTSAHRILTMAHGHPDLRRGGGEIAAYNLFKAYRQHPEVDAAWFLAASQCKVEASGRISQHRPEEYLWQQHLADLFTMKAANRSEITGYFSELLIHLQPTIVHTHHYFQFGLEYLKAIKKVDSCIFTVLTLHEYMAICPNRGLMLNPDTQERCSHGDFATHRHCAPGRTAEDLWLRKHRFDRYFDCVDHFVAPSEFLRQRYIEWGIAPDRISTLENGQPSRTAQASRPIKAGAPRNRFGYFGQINAYKGLEVILAGLSALPQKKRRKLRLEIHGANLQFQPRAFRERIHTLASPLIAEGVVLDQGAYAPAELADRMAGVDWVVVPSVWYENSPLVIQEAFAFGRPVIASNIGGMAEKVTDGVGGVTLPPGNPACWAGAMLQLSEDTDLWAEFQSTLPCPISCAKSVQQHLSLFATVRKGL